MSRPVRIAMALLATPALVFAAGVQTTYLWHMHQPIYWPQSTSGSGSGYEKALDTMTHAAGRGMHPTEDLASIFGKADREADYQYRMKDAIGGMAGSPDAGAQATMSGALMQNIAQLGAANWGAYSPGWTANGDARGWNTSAGKPRLDLLCIPAHHPIAAFADARTLALEIRVHRYLTQLHYGTNAPYSKGFFPPEMCFAPRIIPTLVREGFDWVAVADNHLSRACSNFPYVAGSGGELCDPPNRSDQLNPDGANWFRKHIDRGCAPCNAVPFAVRPHYTQAYDPHSGAEFRIIAVPAEMALSWDDGYSAMGTADIDGSIAPYNDPARPCLLMMCHDGDNAYGGGYSYYMESVPNFTSAAVGQGYHPTTVEQYLHDYPVPSNDIVHVEAGGWVNADGDFGSPFMLNWTWFLWKDDRVDIEQGWHYKLRDYAIRMAALNWVLEAEAVVGAGAIDIARVAEPYGGASAAEKAWHFYLGALDSGFQYFGNPGDNEIRVTIACNEAYHNAVAAVGGNADHVGPTVWVPQRYPWNPGGESFGPQNYGEHGTWGPVTMGKDFYVWTFAYDRSGIQAISVLYRRDKDGVNDMDTNHNETFAGGSDVESWQSQAMTDRGVFPRTMDGFGGLENINYELPEVIAHHYWSKITSATNTLYDYAIVAVDTLGHAATTDIQHVYVGASLTGGSGGGDAVATKPDPPVRGAACTVSYDSNGRTLSAAPQVNLHLGANNWSPVIVPDIAMTGTPGGVWAAMIFVSDAWTQIDFVFNNGAGVWDNNGGSDWHVTTVPGDVPPNASFTATPRSGDAPLNVQFSDTSSGLVTWRAWEFGDGGMSGGQNPAHIYSNAGSYTVMLTVSNQYGASTNVQADYVSVTQPGTPTALFTAAPRVGPVGTAVQFSDQSSGIVDAWLWQFGDGGASTQQHPHYVYSSPGVFDVTLVVSGPIGASTNTQSDYIRISQSLATSIDGTNIIADFAGAARVLQDTPTGWGDATTPGVGGSELDALYVTNTFESLRIGLTGNVELNGNCMMLFIDSVPGGVNVFSNGMSFTCPELGNMVGVVFDSAFVPDYALVQDTYNGGHNVDFEQLVGTTYDAYCGQGTGDVNVARTLVHPATGLRYGHNNSNVGGITAGSVAGADTVDTGWEVELPLTVLGIEPATSGVVKVQAIITSRMTPDSRWIANQSLPGVGGDSGVQGQLGTGRVGNYASVAGVQYLAYAYEAIPEPGCGLVVLALAVLMKRARGGTRMGNKRGSGL